MYEHDENITEGLEEELEAVQESQLSESDIEEMTDAFFPIRDENNKPTYREYQRETIIQICKSFLIYKKKYVAVDGPVGCGKSAINYTVARILGDAVYLTPLKMLQDQIVTEGWDGVKMIKGRSSYACNHCGYDDNKFRCNYAGDEHSTCQNSRPRNNYRKTTIQDVSAKIEKLFKENEGNQFVLRLRSAFSSPAEFNQFLPRMRDFFKTKMEAGTYDQDIEKNIACSMDSRDECPVKSSRFLAKMSPVKVLNPDIFFMITRSYNEFYSENSLMIYDECQQIEGVLNRIFQVKIPIDIIRDMFGLDLSFLHQMDEMKGLLDSTLAHIYGVLGPTVAMSKMLGILGDICNVRNFPTIQRMQSQGDTAKKLMECANGFLFKKWGEDREWEFSMFEVLNYSFTGDPVPEKLIAFKPFIEHIRGFFIDYCEKYNCDMKADLYSVLVPSCKRMFYGNDLNRMRKHKTRDLTDSEKNSNIELSEIMVSQDRVYADHLILLRLALEPFIDNINSLSFVGDKDHPAFTISKSTEPSKRACAGNILQKYVIDNPRYANTTERCLEVVPIAINKLMQMFFYSKADKVLLTSGTWVSPTSVFKLYGLPESQTEFIKIPSTFDVKSRPVYVIDNRKFTNFSERDDDSKMYSYKTESGTRKFTLELSSIVNRIRRYIKDNHNENANIVVHCHTFEIAERIAEFAPGVNESYLIHLPQAGSHIQNDVTKYTVWAKSKDELIQILRDSPNSGLTIVSPSISEGVDFKDKIARAQIILKRPIPYLGDVYVKSYYKGNPEIGIEKDLDFLDRICFTTMIQQYGRVVRSKDDWGYTVVMDQSITETLKLLLKKNQQRIRDLNIGYFMDGIQFELDKSGAVVFNWIFG